MILTINKVLGIKGRNRPVPSYLAAETFDGCIDILLSTQLPPDSEVVRVLFGHRAKCINDVVELESS